MSFIVVCTHYNVSVSHMYHTCLIHVSGVGILYELPKGQENFGTAIDFE